MKDNAGHGCLALVLPVAILVFEPAAAWARVVAADLGKGRCLAADVSHLMHHSLGIRQLFGALSVLLEHLVGTATFEAPAWDGV